MSAQQLITEHIDLWTSAIKAKNTQGRGSNKKRELYGIKKLRGLILELAVRGKLVPQDLSDEPASVLLERIAKEKAQLIKEKQIKKQKPLPEITDEEKLFDLPAGWEWTRLSDVYDVRDGTHDSPKPLDDGIPLVTSKNLSSGKLDLSNIKYISIDDHLKIQERSAVEINDILFAMIGSIGNPVLVDIEPSFSIKNVALFKYYSLNLSSPYFLKYFLEHSSKIFKEQSSGAVQSFVSLGKIRSFVFALPSLEEQHRIVAKVDELMALCDELEHQTESSLDAHNLLVNTLLSTLTDARDAKELSDNWARFMATDGLYAGNTGAISGSPSVFDTLITTDYAVEQLKQTILQLAVMGKLVPQDPNDEPASELLKRITAEKEQLIKDKKIKKQKSLPIITSEEIPFVLPYGWEWTRLDDIGRDWGQKAPDSDFTYIDVSAIDNTTGTIKSPNILNANDAPSRARKLVAFGTVLYSTVRPYLKNICVIEENISPTPIASTAFATLHPLQEMPGKFFSTYLRSPVFVRYVESVQTGIAYPAINDKQFFSGLTPLPPLPEQHRIVAKVDELMALCDHLKAGIYDAQTIQIKIADALVSNATGSEIKDIEKMKAPDNVLVTNLKLKVSPNDKDQAPLSDILTKHKGELTAKKLWQLSKMDIDVFYQQLKVEMESDWIVEPEKAQMKEKR